MTRLRGRYDHEVRYSDAMVRRLVEHLRSRGRFEDGLGVIASDHGEGLFEHADERALQRTPDAPLRELLYQTHGSHLYREATGVPLVLFGSGVPAGTRIDVPVENIDLFPTLAELAGIAVPPDLDGHSLVPLLHGEGAPPREFVFSYLDHLTSVREVASDWKLVVPGAGGHAVHHEQELFHLREDPFERANHRAQEPAVAARLEARLAQWLNEHGGEADDALDADERTLLEGLGYTDVELDGPTSD